MTDILIRTVSIIAGLIVVGFKARIVWELLKIGFYAFGLWN